MICQGRKVGGGEPSMNFKDTFVFTPESLLIKEMMMPTILIFSRYLPNQLLDIFQKLCVQPF